MELSNAEKSARLIRFIRQTCGNDIEVIDRKFGLIWRCNKCHCGTPKQRERNQARLYDVLASDPDIAPLLA